MRRLTLLGLAALFLIGLVPAAQAGEVTKSRECLSKLRDTPGTTISATVVGTPTGAVDDHNRSISTLRRITITNQCQEWGQVDIGRGTLWVFIAPNTSHTIGRPGLEKVGDSKVTYPEGELGVMAKGTAVTPCDLPFHASGDLYVLADGRLSTSPPPCA